uniref:Non-specific phospholipase C2 n=1 Tax=Populus trichocarpa TaxID=3694 RepID=B9HNG8_POPTR|eukprot:XP_002314000.2 non-specific phospholipase C2 isoform X1 [Populus trichocarpa]
MQQNMSTKRPTTIFLLLLLVLFHDRIHASPIKTVVVVVMENRSFDHMLGWMKKINPEINGVDGTQWNPLNISDPSSQKFFTNTQAQYVDPDPGHSFQAIREQIFGSEDTSKNPPPMNGFAQQAFSMDASINLSRDVMNGFEPDMVAVYKTLVSEFSVFDRWFASVPSSTQPNRLFVHSATSAGATSNIPALLVKGYPQRTIFENLDDAGISWGIYYQNIPATLFYSNLRKLKHITKFHPYGMSFKKHAKQGKLPGYAVLEQRYMDIKISPANDDHPSHDVYQGQMFVKEVYETLRASPQWNETLLVITYDEHGGFYDHVATPVSGVPSPDGIVGPEPFLFKFDRLGVRVPTIVVSPWIEKGTVVHGPNGSPFSTSEYEHSSIPATVKKLFNMPSPFLTRRDEWAGTFEGILQTRTEPRTDCPVQLPTPTQVRKSEPNEDAKLTEFQQELLQLAAVLKGDHILTSYPDKIGKEMTVKQGNDYMEDALKRFFEAGLYAKSMGVDEEQIVQMRPSLTTRPSKPTSQP